MTTNNKHLKQRRMRYEAKNLRNVSGVVGGIVACGAVGGLQQETMPLLQGTLCMILGILMIAACMHDRD